MSKVLIESKIKALYQVATLAAIVGPLVAYNLGYENGVKSAIEIRGPAPAVTNVGSINPIAPKRMTEENAAELVKSWLPGLGITSDSIIHHERVRLFQFMVKSEIFYLNEDGSAIFKGDVFDTAMLNHDPERANLTDQFERALAFSKRQSDSFSELQARTNVSTQSGVQELLKSIKEDGVITFTPEGNSRDTFYVFFDITCPECKRFTPEITDLQKLGYTVKVILVSRKGTKVQAYKNSSQLACQVNKTVEFINYMRSGFSGFSKRCEADLSTNMDAAAILGIRGTPSIIRFNDAKLFEGLHYANELEN